MWYYYNPSLILFYFNTPETKTVPGTNGNEESGDVDTTNDDVENEVERISDESRAADKGTNALISYYILIDYTNNVRLMQSLKSKHID